LDPFIVQVATDGQEALALLDSEPEFDVILCDLMMPRVSGAELFRRISLQNPHLSKRFVFVTGGAFADWSQRFLDTVERPIIEKPFQPAQLRKCIESVARQARRSI
jgi:two-component system, cell cycle sensor histidine kinase and response regulator CckA